MMKVVNVDNAIVPSIPEEKDNSLVVRLAGYQIEIEKDTLQDAEYLVLWTVGRPGDRYTWYRTIGNVEVLKIFTETGEEIPGIRSRDEGPIYLVLKTKGDFKLFWGGEEVMAYDVSEYFIEVLCSQEEWSRRLEVRKHTTEPVRI